MSGADGAPPQGDMSAIMNHVQSQIRLNFILFFYSLTTEAVITACARLSVVCTLGDIAYRWYSMYLLSQVAAQHNSNRSDSPTEHLPVQRRPENQAHSIHPPSDVEVRNEDNDRFPPDTVREDLSDERPLEYGISKVESQNQVFPSACQEMRYDLKKERFCSGR